MIKKPDEKVIKDSLKKLSWDLLQKHIETIDLNVNYVEKIYNLVLISESLIIKRKLSKQEEKRNHLIKCLGDFFESKKFFDAASNIRSYGEMVCHIDAGYHGILNLLKKTDSEKLTPELRISSLIDRSNKEYINLLEEVKRNTPSKSASTSRMAINRNDGGSYNPESAYQAIVNSIFDNINMEAYANNWFANDGTLIIPDLPESNEESQYVIGSTQILAAAWRSWARAEQRYRYLGGDLDRVDPPVESNEYQCNYMWQSTPGKNGWEFYDYCSNQRLYERLLQDFADITTNPIFIERIANKEENSSRSLLQLLIEINGLHALNALQQILSISGENDIDEYAGLSLKDWALGYSTLQSISHNAFENKSKDLLIVFERVKLVEILEQSGLSNNKASIFINCATLQKRSRDLFDQPILKLRSGKFALLAIAAASSSIPQIVLSTLSMLDVNLNSRGKRFEKHILDFLTDNGFNARAIKFKSRLDKQEYDYDVAFVWGGYLFILECKSKGLSGNDPMRAHYFMLGINDAVNQVKRLRDGLRENPGVLESKFPEAKGKTVIFCVINALPYALCNGIDDIYFIDESGFTKFFKNPTLGEKSIDPKERIANYDAVAHLWSDNAPTPEDFLYYLKQPIQLLLAKAHTIMAPCRLPLGEQCSSLVFNLTQKDGNPESIRAAICDTKYYRNINSVSRVQT